MNSKRLAMVTGASSGIGEASARIFARDGWNLAIGARREERIAKLARELEKNSDVEVFCRTLDVTDESSVETYVGSLLAGAGTPDCLINNAGLARGLELVADAGGQAWREMIETNLFGVLRVTRSLLPAMLERGSGHIIMVGSVAGHLPYAKGSVYCATKRALQSVCGSLRLETLGRGIRVSSVDPGLVETEFSLVRFAGDAERASRVYEGVHALTSEDIAECILFAASRPPHVNVDNILVMPTIQADPYHLHRG